MREVNNSLLIWKLSISTDEDGGINGKFPKQQKQNYSPFFESY